MAYTFEQSYYFRPYRGNSSFWLNRYGNGSIASHQKATLYTAAGSADQRLKVHKVSGGCQLLSDLNNKCRGKPACRKEIRLSQTKM